ncbi:hypothetical protein FNV43_RR12550 [Rhamnella rubrinervis]|uniref:Uncharacterized protein n=1 Tax=Rhamnella rubrinervis TaxID=2594499 RepID=A0A8K0MID8_9ROSA|nr:hypothetical protein FNV43_RR12550 [Rhamnella rubrinervis]
MKARGSTVDLIIADENSGNGERLSEAGSHKGPSLFGDGMNTQLCPPFSFPWISEVPNGLIPVDLNDGIPCLPKPSAVPKEVRSIFGRVGSAGLGKAVEFLDTFGSSMTNLGLSNGFPFGETGRKREISILAFEVAKTIVKGEKLMKSLSKDNIKRLKEVVLQSEGVKSLISTDTDKLLRIVAADKREELERFSGEIVRFGNLCKDLEWHNLDRYFEKLHSKRPPQRHLKEEPEAMMQQLMNLVQHTAELFCQLQVLDKLEQEYRHKLQGVDSLNADRKGEIAILSGALKSRKKHVISLKKKSLWSKVFEEVIKKLVDIVHFLHLEIHEAFGNSDGDKSVEGYRSNLKILGPAGIALRYASIITKVDALVSRSSPVHPNMRDSLYQLLPHDMKSALDVKLKSFQVERELIPAIKAEMDETLLWIVPIARNTTKALHSFGWLGEWANAGLVNQKPAGQVDILRIETLHYADVEKTEAYIIKLLVWLHLINQVKIGDGGMGSTVKSSFCSLNHETVQFSTRNPNDPSPMLMDKDQEILQSVGNMKFIRGISKSQKIDTSKTRLSKYDRLSKSSKDASTSETVEDPFAIGWPSCAPVIDLDIDKIRALNVIDGLEIF